MRIAFLTAPEGVEEAELTVPWKAVETAGRIPQLVSTEPGRVQAFNHLAKANAYPVEHLPAGDTSDAFDALVLPGGVANPDALRMNERAVDFHPEPLRDGQAVRGHLPRALDPERGRCRTRRDADVVTQPGDRRPQRGRHLGR